MNFAEMVAFLLSLPMAMLRSITPRKFQADFNTYRTYAKLRCKKE